MPISEVPPETIFKDAINLGYTVFAFVYDEEEQKMWCINCLCYLNNCSCFKDNDEANTFLRSNLQIGEVLTNDEESFRLSMEKLHGGPLTGEDELAFEIGPHVTWHDPANPDAVVSEDGPCFCGWLGIDPPAPEFAPPGCSCVATKSQDEECDE